MSAETRAIARAADAAYVAAPGRRCASVARNAALRLADGDFIAFLDDDDVWLESHLAAHIELLEKDSAFDAVLGRVVSADHSLRRVSAPWPSDTPEAGVEILRRMLSGYYPQIGALVARREVCEAFGYFDERLVGGEDLDWMLRIARLGFVSVESVLFRQRRRGSYDALQLARAGYDRSVWMRHALKNWRVWRGFGEVWLAHYGALRHHYVYFVDAAASRAALGRRLSALQAIAYAAYIFPLRALLHVFSGKRLGMALAATASPRRRRRTQKAIALSPLIYALIDRVAPLLTELPL